MKARPKLFLLSQQFLLIKKCYDASTNKNALKRWSFPNNSSSIDAACLFTLVSNITDCIISNALDQRGPTAGLRLHVACGEMFL